MIEGNNPLRFRNGGGSLIVFTSPQEGLVPFMRPLRQAGMSREEVIAKAKASVIEENGPAPAGTANNDWLDDAVYEAAWSLSKPLTQSRTIRGSVLSGLSAVSAAIIQVSQDILPHAIVASESVSTVWPQAVRWVLIVICLAGAWMSYSARVTSRDESMQ